MAGLRGQPAAALVTQFERARADAVAMVAGMADADFDRIGRHPWFGRVPLEQMLAGDLAEIGRKLIKRGGAMASSIMRFSVKRIGKVGKNNFREIGIEFT